MSQATISQQSNLTDKNMSAAYRTSFDISDTEIVPNSPGKETRPSSPLHFPNVIKSPNKSAQNNRPVSSALLNRRKPNKENQTLNLDYSNNETDSSSLCSSRIYSR